MEGFDSRKELLFWWTGFEPYERFISEEVEGRFSLTYEEEKKVQEEFAKNKAKNPHFFDGALWRYEKIFSDSRGVIMEVSPITYMPHNVLRFEKRQLNNYPNPISINAVQVTADGYIPVGVKGTLSDQKGLEVMGAGFVKRKIDKEGKNYPPENVFQTAERECLEETSYRFPFPFDKEDCYALGAIFGSNHDTTICVYIPLKVEKKDISLGNQEHSDLLFLKTDKTCLDDFLNTGGIKNIPAADHFMGDVVLYMEMKYKRNLIR